MDKGGNLEETGPAIIVLLLIMSVSPSGYAEEGTGNPPGAAGKTAEAAAKTKEDVEVPGQASG
jgi:hypothetical protein